MKMQIVGIQPQSYTLDSGYSFTGTKVYAIDLDATRDGLIGHVTTDFKFSADSDLAAIPLHPGDVCNVYFDQRKQVAFLQVLQEGGKG